MIDFERVVDLGDFPEDMVVVQVFEGDAPPHAVVRSHFPNRISMPDDRTVSECLDEAVRMVTQDAFLSRLGVFLDGNAEWNPAWGNLIPMVE